MAHPRQLLEKLGASPLKSLSQNFLISPHWADLLTTSVVEGASPTEYWEVGPGLGALTQVLIKKIKVPLILFEYDRKISAHLRETFPELTLYEGDVMDQDFVSLSQGKKISVLSNLPYHLSSPLLFKWIAVKDCLTHLVLTFQKEFADRLVAPPRTPDYGALSILIQLHFSIEKLGILPEGAFYPAPSIASAALKLVPQTPENIDFPLIEKLVKAAFSQRRKKMASNLKNVLGPAPWEEALVQLGFHANTRAEELSKEDFVHYSRLVAQFNATC